MSFPGVRIRIKVNGVPILGTDSYSLFVTSMAAAIQGREWIEILGIVEAGIVIECQPAMLSDFVEDESAVGEGSDPTPPRGLSD